jgi:hypothetical protein
LLSLIFCLLMQTAPGDDLASAASPGHETRTTAPAPAPAPAIILPKGTLLLIAVEQEMGSKISQTGQAFPIRLAEAVVVDGVEVLPAGLRGEGQVVHAKKGGMAGAAGELVLAARYLDHGKRRIMLRSFKFIEAGDEILTRGKDNIGVASATNAVIGPLGFFIGGGNTTIPSGTIATAKTREDEAFVPENAGAGHQHESTEEGVQ